MRLFVSDAEQQARNDKLIDLCFDEAVKVCAKAEGFGNEVPWDWNLPSKAEFRRIVRAARADSYRVPTTPSPEDRK